VAGRKFCSPKTKPEEFSSGSDEIRRRRVVGRVAREKQLAGDKKERHGGVS
jgi:hypothetical protein